MRTATIAATVLLLLTASCQDNGRRTAAGKKFSGRDYSMQNIHGWEQASGAFGTDYFWGSPQEGPADSFRENINVVLDEIPPGVSRQQYIEASVDGMKSHLDIQGDVDYQPTKVNGLDAHLAHVRYQMGGFDLVLDSYAIIDGSHVYVISCTAMEDTYDKYKPKFQEMLDTFSLK